jgi:MFS family permease
MIDFNFITQFRTKGKYKKAYANVKASYLRRIRWAVSMFYFSMGLCFASWASRIPDVKAALELSEGQLGTILLAVPVGQIATMPLSGKMVTRFGSYKIAVCFVLLYASCLLLLGLTNSAVELWGTLFLFGVFGNFANIAVNTQGVYTEALIKKPIISSFHGMWSLAGFVGAAVGLGMLALKLSPFWHFAVVAGFVLILVGSNYKFLIKAREKVVVEKKKLFSKPDSSLLWLGAIAFCCKASEGVMFDWSGLYFKTIVNTPGALVILGYTSFMVMMTGGRFFGDQLIHRIGSKKIMQISGAMISIGLFTAVIFPYLIPATLAFMLVGLGVSTIVPTVYSAAGKNKTVNPGQALTVVSSISFLGFLMGPPIIGYIAELFSLRLSFAFIGIFGFLIALMVSRVKAIA